MDITTDTSIYIIKEENIAPRGDVFFVFLLIAGKFYPISKKIQKLVDITTSLWYNALVVKTTFGGTMLHRFETFTVLMANIGRSIRKIKTEEMDEFHLKSTHVSCLYYLFREGELTATELCERCEEDKANISRSVKYLEENGCLSCDSKHVKRYQSPLTLTDKGREIGGKIVLKVDNILSHAGDGVPEEDRRVMYRSLAVICENLQKISESCGASAAMEE